MVESTINAAGAVSVTADQVATIKATDISVIKSRTRTDGNAASAMGGVSVANYHPRHHRRDGHRLGDHQGHQHGQ